MADHTIPTPGTPLPWPLERSGDGKRYLVGKGLVEGPHGYEVAEVYADDCDPKVAKANAAYIVTACNLFPELVEALSDLLADMAAGVSHTTGIHERCKAVLAKAGAA